MALSCGRGNEILGAFFIKMLHYIACVLYVWSIGVVIGDRGITWLSPRENILHRW